MTPPLSRAAWVDRFVMHMSELGARAEPDMIVMFAEELWPHWGHVDPVEVAQAEWDDGPLNDD